MSPRSPCGPRISSAPRRGAADTAYGRRTDVFRSSPKNGRWFSTPKNVARIKCYETLIGDVSRLPDDIRARKIDVIVRMRRLAAWSMVGKTRYRVSEKIMLKQKEGAG